MSTKVGVIGAGTVGGGVIKAFREGFGLGAGTEAAVVELTHVAELNQDCLAEFDLTGVTVTTDADVLIDEPGVQVICELIGGLEPAKTLILKALRSGKHVVTANKMLLAHHGAELSRAAVDNGVELRFEAAVAGAIPIIKALNEGLAANRIELVSGILNGTCNYILTRMTDEGLEFDEVLKRAQELGFAETPPDLDIEGLDTAHKCQIIASLCFSTEVDIEDIYVEGITRVTHADVAYASDMGYVIRLLAIMRNCGDAIEARVHPTLVPNDHLLSSVRNEYNAIHVQSDLAGATMYYGKGAGRMPTASAVVADVVDIARRTGAPATPPFVYGPKRPVRDIGRLRGRYYLRLTTLDKPGVLGSVCTVLGHHDVSIASCIQREEHVEDAVHIVMMTHETQESSLRAALREIDTYDFVREPTHMLRVL